MRRLSLPRPRLCLLAGAVHEKRNRTNPEEECKTRVKIYQINLDRDQAHAAFRSLEEAQDNTGQTGVDASLYDEVFNAELDPKSLEELFIQFNSEWHPLHRGRSMAVLITVQSSITVRVSHNNGGLLICYIFVLTFLSAVPETD